MADIQLLADLDRRSVSFLVRDAIARASGYLNLKQYRQSVRDFDKVLELNSETTAAHSDRGLAKLELGEYVAAIFDFQEAIRRKEPGDTFLSTLYEDSGDEHLKVGSFQDAIADYSKAIERRLANDVFLFSVHQIRLLYPEYDRVSDETLCRKLNVLLFPQMEYEVFAKQLMEKNGKWGVSLLNGLYEKRGDTYLKAATVASITSSTDDRVWLLFPSAAAFTEATST